MRLNEKYLVEFLEARSPERFTVAQIAKAILEKHPEYASSKQARRKAPPDGAPPLRPIQDQIGAEISRGMPLYRNKHPRLRVIETSPRMLYMTPVHPPGPETSINGVAVPSLTSPEQIPAVPGDARHAGNESASHLASSLGIPLEEKIYPSLYEFMANRLGLYAKRVDERRSKNTFGKHGNRWLYRDAVSMEDLTARWHMLVRNCVREEGGQRARLWSFEVKRGLHMGNVRKHFYQAVSNYSWAHFRYLVAVEIDDLAMDELRILSATHGIWVIVIDLLAPTEGSEIRLPAQERPIVDWHAWNRIAVENEGMLQVIERYEKFLQSGEIDPSYWSLAPPARRAPGSPQPARPRRTSKLSTGRPENPPE